jgi:hypothetical protein
MYSVPEGREIRRFRAQAARWLRRDPHAGVRAGRVPMGRAATPRGILFHWWPPEPSPGAREPFGAWPYDGGPPSLAGFLRGPAPAYAVVDPPRSRFLLRRGAASRAPSVRRRRRRGRRDAARCGRRCRSDLVGARRRPLRKERLDGGHWRWHRPAARLASRPVRRCGAAHSLCRSPTLSSCPPGARPAPTSFPRGERATSRGPLGRHHRPGVEVPIAERRTGSSLRLKSARTRSLSPFLRGPRAWDGSRRKLPLGPD